MTHDAKQETAKITYATTATGHMEELQREIDVETARVRTGFGETHPMFINGKEVVGSGVFDDISPNDTRILIGRFQRGTRDRVKDAVAAAHAAYSAWTRRPWEERARLVRRIGKHIRARRAELSVLIGYEAGKSRLEAAGIFSEDEAEIEEFFTRIEAGVTYANRRAGATTGAWPGINSFGGWKASGSTGKGTGGPHYLQQFFREQSRVRVR